MRFGQSIPPSGEDLVPEPKSEVEASEGGKKAGG